VPTQARHIVWKSEVEIMKRGILLVTVVFLLPAVCLGRGGSLFPAAWYVPFDRLIANTEAFIRDHPSDPQGYYTLARMHYFTFLNRLPLVATTKPDASPPDNVAADWQTDPARASIVDRLLWDVRYDQARRLVLEAWGYAAVEDVPASRLAQFNDEVWVKAKELEDQGWKAEYLDTSRILTHAGTAVDNFERALDLDPNNGLYSVL
jgi:hypothetical protein